MTHEARQLQLMRDVLRFVPDEHQREAGDALLKLIADVRSEAACAAIVEYRTALLGSLNERLKNESSAG